MTDADAKAEHAAAAIIRAARPDDAIIGEEGTDDAGESTRRWYIDGIDGTVAFANRLPGGWCSAVVLADEHGPLATAVHDPSSSELYAAARGQGATCNDEPLAIRTGRTLDTAHVALFLRQDRLVQPGVRANGHAILDRSGLLRHAGPGTLELAWVAAGRLDAWVQPLTDPWDWLPGQLLVEEAHGTTQVIHRDVRWHVAGASPLVDALVELLT